MAFRGAGPTTARAATFQHRGTWMGPRLESRSTMGRCAPSGPSSTFSVVWAPARRVWDGCTVVRMCAHLFKELGPTSGGATSLMPSLSSGASTRRSSNPRQTPARPLKAWRRVGARPSRRLGEAHLAFRGVRSVSRIMPRRSPQQQASAREMRFCAQVAPGAPPQGAMCADHLRAMSPMPMPPTHTQGGEGVRAWRPGAQGRAPGHNPPHVARLWAPPPRRDLPSQAAESERRVSSQGLPCARPGEGGGV